MLSELDYAATTADCWSAHCKSYLGMTAYWIDPFSRARKHSVLACIRIHTYDVLAQAVANTQLEFGIQKKVTR